MANRPSIGPTMPPGYISASRGQDDLTDDDEDGDIGPALPPAAGDHVARDEDGLTYAERTFLEREQRKRQAEMDAKAAQEVANNSRPEWMLAPPPSSSLSSLLQPSGGPLKARGFSQNTRIQKGSSAIGPSAGADDAGTTVWTETPQERVERLKNDLMGTGSATSQDREGERRKRTAEIRDAELRERVRRLDGETARTKSLLEVHQEARRRELLERKGNSNSVERRESSSVTKRGLKRLEELDGSDGEETRARDHEDFSDDASGKGGRRHGDEGRRRDRHVESLSSSSRRRKDRQEPQRWDLDSDKDKDEKRKHRDRRSRREEVSDDNEGQRRGEGRRSRSRSPSTARRRKYASRHGDEDDDDDTGDRRRDPSRERDRHDRHSSRRRHHHHHRRRHRSSSRSRSRSRSPSPSSRTRAKEKQKSSSDGKAAKEKEIGKGGASTMIWDRERAMSFIPLMDEKKKARLLNDARGLGDRFGSSGSGSHFL